MKKKTRQKTAPTMTRFAQFLADQTPVFDKLIMESIQPTDGWLLNVSSGPTPWGWMEERVKRLTKKIRQHRHSFAAVQRYSLMRIAWRNRIQVAKVQAALLSDS